MERIIITGMSGAGKSQAVKALEDIGFYCVDNLPPALLPKFMELCAGNTEAPGRVAMVTDVRSGPMFDELFSSLEAMEKAGLPCRVLFLDCADETLCRRFKETRRRHPLAGEQDSTEAALEKERRILEPLVQRADYRIDTTHLGTAQLKQRITELFLEQPSSAMTIECMSFGFKYGFPAEADLMLDVRCFPNPFYVPSLKHQTGLDPEVQNFVLQAEETQEFLRRLYHLLDYLIPLYVGEGKSQLVIAIGCTGGKHRSVTVTEQLAAYIRERGHRVLTEHRDIHKK